MTFETLNPATEKRIREYQLASAIEIEGSLERSVSAYHSWRRLDLNARLQFLKKFEEAMAADQVRLADLITEEMGKVRKEAVAEVAKCIASCRTIRENFPKWKAERDYTVPPGYSVHHEPLGVILGIMPWNFPLWQVVRFAIPTLLNGNTALMKHAPNTWGSAEALEALFRKAFPEDVYINLKIDVPMVGRLIEDPRVRGVSLTGSRRAGQSVGALAGQNLKKCVLELGGSDAYVILDDADLDLAADICSKSRLLNAGQSCISAKRFIVTKKNVAAFTERFRAHLEKARFGDPLKETTDIGPLARRDLRDQLAGQVAQSIARGAKLAFGGVVPKELGFYYPPTLLTQVKPGQIAFDEELFGPVAAVIEAENESQALVLANRSRYGLGGAVFSRDIERARKIAIQEIEAGMVFVNDFVRSDAMVPFGGIKDSGIGREIGRDGAFEFTNVKLIKA